MSVLPAHALRRASIAASVLLLLLPALASGAASTLVTPIKGVIYLKYAKDAQLQQSELNLQFTAAGCGPTGSTVVCDGNAWTGKASSLTKRSSTGLSSAEGGVGFRFQLNQSCSGQQLRGTPRLDFTYSYRLVSDSLGTSSTATASVNTRILSVGESAVAGTTFNDGLGTAHAGETTFPRTAVGLVFGAPLDATVGAATSVDYVRLNNQPAALSFAQADVTFQKLGFVFGDVTPPGFEASTSSSDASPEEPTPAVAPLPPFAGWHQGPVSVVVDARDLDNPDAAKAVTEPISCVERAVFHDSDDDLDETRFPGFDQVPVSVAYSGDRKYLVDLLVYDHQGNQAPVQTRYFGVDQNAPVTTPRLFPGASTGLDGWYNRSANGTGVKAWLDCADGSPRASQCEDRRLLEGAMNRSFTTTDIANGWAVPDGNHSYAYKSVDHAGNWETAKTLPLKVDTVAPSVALAANVSPPLDPSWYDRNVTVNGTCSDATSLCLWATVDAGAGPVPLQAVPVAGHGQHTLAWAASDRAGNLGSGTKAFHVDLVPPPAPTMTTPAPNAFLNARTSIRWTGVVDDGSGVHHYEYRANNGSAVSTGLSTVATLQPADGRYCYQARAVDKVNRLSPWSGMLCVTFDATAPSVTLERPTGGRLVVDGNETVVPGLPGNKVVVIGPFTARAVASDATSGLDRVEIRNTLLSDTPTVCLTPPSPCERLFDGTGIASPPRLLQLQASAWDRAGNTATTTPTRDVAQVVIHADTVGAPVGASSPSSSGEDGAQAAAAAAWRGNVVWHPLDHGDFVAYELHRSNLPDFLPTALTLVDTITDPARTSYEDAGLAPGQDVYYRVRYVTSAWHLDSHTTHVDTVEGGAGEPGECGALGCREVLY